MTKFTALQVTFCIPKIAEALATIRVALETLERYGPPEMAAEAKDGLRADLLYYEHTTRVPR